MRRWIESKFGERLSQMMSEQGISQSELARLAGCDRSSVFRVIRGDMLPGMDIVMSFAEVLACDELDLLTIPEAHLRHRIIDRMRFAPVDVLEEVERALDTALAKKLGIGKRVHR